MSATLDCSAVSRLLNDAPIIVSEGRSYSVRTSYAVRPTIGPIEPAVVSTIRHALTEEPGSILVFLPGMAEIRRVERRLRESHFTAGVEVYPLHGDLPQEIQEAAISPAPAGRRKIVLATSIAETSLTIEGIRVVVDAGLMRVPRFSPRTGLTRLETVRVTQDAADQRRGRAGRLESGVCYRLWTEAEHQSLLPRRSAEIVEADLASLALESAEWGAGDASNLTWLDPPPPGALMQARRLLVRLGALDESGSITPHGRRLVDLALHPRLAHMILKAMPLGLGGLACELAALLSDRDILQGPAGWRNTDLRIRLEVLRSNAGVVHGATVNRALSRHIEQVASQWKRRLRIDASSAAGSIDSIGLLLAFAYPDRVAQRQAGSDRRYLLANGRGASFAQEDPLAREPYLAVAHLDDSSQWPSILLAAPLVLDELLLHEPNLIGTSDVVVWDAASETVLARRRRQFGELMLEDRPLPDPNPAQITAALLSGIRCAGLSCLPWTKELRQWQARVLFARRTDQEPARWPNVSDQALLDTLETWLGPFIQGIRNLHQVRGLNLTETLQSLLSWAQRKELDRLAPSHLMVPSGSQIRLDYEAGERPVLAVKLQEMFGCRETPLVGGGTVPVMVHLLSPAGRPVQVTQDLASFWASTYQEVKKELRGRYPKHPWPDDPFNAEPTRRTKRFTTR
jgi:ATP-dependent helicase HrpB